MKLLDRDTLSAKVEDYDRPELFGNSFMINVIKKMFMVKVGYLTLVDTSYKIWLVREYPFEAYLGQAYGLYDTYNIHY